MSYGQVFFAVSRLVTIHADNFMPVCALLLDDKQKLCAIGRFFMSEHQFISDSYRLYAALHRICGRPNPFYNGSPTQKFILRQIKAMDWSVMPLDRRSAMEDIWSERAGFSMKDAEGKEIQATDLDVPMLMLYGQLLHANGSSMEAINYFYRARALDPDHPLVNFSLAVSYLHYALKRQSLNRHAHVMQGLSFLFRYRELRMASGNLAERQEVEFNTGRAFHMLGLEHLALPYYRNVLEIGEEIRKGWEEDEVAEQQRQQPGGEVDMADGADTAGTEPRSERDLGTKASRQKDQSREDFTLDAAYALQDLYAMAGNTRAAQAIVEKYMVL